MLKGVAELINNSAESCCGFAARWGGEEFLLIFPNMPYSHLGECLTVLLENVRAAVFTEGENKISVTITLGGVIRINSESADDTINRADKLLYEGKTTGRNRIIIRE